MKPLQATKAAIAMNPQTIASATVNGTAIDTLGYNALHISFQVGATTGVISVLKLQHATDSGFTTPVDISGSTPGALPGATDDNKVWCTWEVPINGTYGRYIRVVATENATGSGIYSALATLSQAAEMPNTATERGVSYVVNLYT